MYNAHNTTQAPENQGKRCWDEESTPLYPFGYGPTPGHRTAARLAGEPTAVLLRNEGGLLPLKKDAYKKISVLGPLADSQIDTIGSWAFQQDLPETVTVLAGLRTKLGQQADLSYAPGVQIRRKIPSLTSCEESAMLVGRRERCQKKIG